MSKHLLTIGLVLLAFLLLRRGCGQPPSVPAISTESAAVPAEGDSYVLEDAERGVTVVLAADGSVVSARAGDADVLRPSPPSRRPLHALLEYANGRTWVLEAEKWSSEKLPDGRRFVYTDGAFRLSKTLRLAPDGAGLDLEMEAEGLTPEMRGFILTAVCGVPLDGEDPPAAGFWQMEGDDAQVFLTRQLVEAKEEERKPRDPAKRLKTPPQAIASRFGVLGREHYVALENVPPTNELYLDVFRARRDAGTTEEIEAYLSLIAPEGRYTGAFALRWIPRSEVAERAPELAEKMRVQPSRTFQVENDRYRAVFTDRGGALLALWHKGYSVKAGAPPSEDTWVPILREGARPGERSLTLHGNGEVYGVDPAHATWAVAVDPGRGATLTLQTPRGYGLRKVVTLPAEGNALDVEIAVTRPAGSDAAAASLTLVGPAASYVEDAYRDIIGLEPPNVVLLERAGGDNETTNLEKISEEPLVRNYSQPRGGIFHAIGLRGAYFFTALVLNRPEGTTDVAGPIRRAEGRVIELERDVERKPGETSRQSMIAKVAFEAPLGADGRGATRFRLYAGPTALGEMGAERLDEAIDFGFFGIIGRALMWLMKFLRGLVGSYGLAIMLMTIVVRGLLFPVSYKTQVGMQRYQKKISKIKPLLDEIQKKYASNPQKLNQEKLKVMREHKIGLPLGCLMMFIQLPIWFALFQALRVEFALRHQPFLWCADLAMPDRLFALPFWPHWFNLFPILMLVLWVVQQRVTPMSQSDDPQVQMQMKMMRFMPYVFFFMLYKYAAALAVYMCVSSAWSIAESTYVRKAIARLG